MFFSTNGFGANLELGAALVAKPRRDASVTDLALIFDTTEVNKCLPQGQGHHVAPGQVARFEAVAQSLSGCPTVLRGRCGYWRRSQTFIRQAKDHDTRKGAC